MILTAVPNSNNSYYALDTDGNNISDGLQFNTKWSGSGPKPYPYTLNTQNAIAADSSAPNELLQDSTGGNWMYDVRSGIIFFPDYNSNLCNNSSNKPVFSFYKYIGNKGISKAVTQGGGVTGPTGPGLANVWYENFNLLNLEDYGNSAGNKFITTEGFLYIQGFIAPITGDYNNIKLKIKNVTINGGSSGFDIEASIYSSNNSTQYYPQTRLCHGSVSKSSLSANEFIDIETTTAATLQRGNLYFVCVKYTSDDNTNVLNFWKYKFIW